MFRPTSIAAFAALVTVGGFTLATAHEPKATGGTNQITNSIGKKLTLVPSGEFQMGSVESAEATVAFLQKNYRLGDRELAEDLRVEHPRHRVRITKPFYLGTCHVTCGQFRQFVEDSGYKTDAEIGPHRGVSEFGPAASRPGKTVNSVNKNRSCRKASFEQTDEHPVINVSWNDAVAFCAWLSKKEGKTYRLPTEAEWEYACRAGTMTRYSSGDDPETLATVGNRADASSAKMEWGIKASDGYEFTAPVGKFKPNAFGLYDMHGNARQWCADWAGGDYYGKSPVDDPPGPDSGDVMLGFKAQPRMCHAMRGSSWGDGPVYARSVYRCRGLPDARDPYTGFRVARTP